MAISLRRDESRIALDIATNSTQNLSPLRPLIALTASFTPIWFCNSAFLSAEREGYFGKPISFAWRVLRVFQDCYTPVTMSGPAIDERVSAIDLNRDFHRSEQGNTAGIALALLGFALVLGICTALHLARRDADWLTENVLLILFASVIAAWSCPKWPIVGLTLVSIFVWYGTDLQRTPNGWICLVGYLCRTTVTLLLIFWTSRAKCSLEQARQFARIDGLTGLPNRQAILETLDSELGRVHRFRRAFSIAMLDCDDFKAINDQQGHLTGDRVLQGIAVALRTSTRAYDCVGRLGGDEFVMILPEVDIDEIPMVIERLRASLRLELVREHPELTFSIGTLTIPFQAGDENPLLNRVDCLRRVDEVMYAAKRSGRDQTRFETLSREA